MALETPSGLQIKGDAGGRPSLDLSECLGHNSFSFLPLHEESSSLPRRKREAAAFGLTGLARSLSLLYHKPKLHGANPISVVVWSTALIRFDRSKPVALRCCFALVQGSVAPRQETQRRKKQHFTTTHSWYYSATIQPGGLDSRENFFPHPDAIVEFSDPPRGEREH